MTLLNPGTGQTPSSPLPHRSAQGGPEPSLGPLVVHGVAEHTVGGSAPPPTPCGDSRQLRVCVCTPRLLRPAQPASCPHREGLSFLSAPWPPEPGARELPEYPGADPEEEGPRGTGGRRGPRQGREGEGPRTGSGRRRGPKQSRGGGEGTPEPGPLECTLSSLSRAAPDSQGLPRRSRAENVPGQRGGDINEAPSPPGGLRSAFSVPSCEQARAAGHTLWAAGPRSPAPGREARGRAPRPGSAVAAERAL